ncbi:hypothetical protein Tco_0175192 [Tanacetum coccineum]
MLVLLGKDFNRDIQYYIRTAMKVNTVKPMVNRVRPANVFHNTHSPSSRPFKRTTVLSKKISNQKVNIAKVNAVSTVGGKRETAVKPSKEFAQETENLVIQEGAAKTSSTNIFSTVSTPAKASSTNLVNTVSIPVSTASPHEGLYLSDPTNPEQDDSIYYLHLRIFIKILSDVQDTKSLDPCRFPCLGRKQLAQSGFNQIRRIKRGFVVRNKARLVLRDIGKRKFQSLQSPPQIKLLSREFLVTMLEQILTGNPQQEVVNFLQENPFLAMQKSYQCGYFYYKSEKVAASKQYVGKFVDSKSNC